MKAKDRTECWECGRERQRCKVATVTENGEIVYVCPECWRELKYDTYLYEHNQKYGG